MEQKALKLNEYRHPDKNAKRKFDSLIGIDKHKNDLLFALQNILDQQDMAKWVKKHHPKGLPYIENIISNDALIILSGDVGCGKTELAHAIGTPLSAMMGGETIVLFETPSDIRGGGFVGDVSKRITAAFDAAKIGLRKGEFGILLIDEADDLATNRDQMQAHHEDRSGVNVLIKEIDKVAREKVNLAVILITNRPNAIDPAVTRRASLHLRFSRPTSEILETLFDRVFDGLALEKKDLSALVKACAKKDIAFSYSDVTKRIAKQSLIAAKQQDIPLSKEVILEVILHTQPSPIIGETQKM